MICENKIQVPVIFRKIGNFFGRRPPNSDARAVGNRIYQPKPRRVRRKIKNSGSLWRNLKGRLGVIFSEMAKSKKATEVQRVIAYVRVSTEMQADGGHSLEAQTSCLRHYAAALGLDIVAFETDAGWSAKSLARPGLTAALAALKAGHADGILVAKLDRLTRSVRDLLHLVDEYFREDYALISVGESVDTRSAAGRMMLKILTTIGEWEREAIGERVSAVMQHMKSEGQFTGGWPPYGYADVDGRLVEDGGEQAVIRRMKELRADGMSLRQISAALEGVGILSRNGRPFDAKQISRVL